MVLSAGNSGDLSMNFALEAAGNELAQDTIVAKFTPEEKNMIVAWLEMSLELDQFSESGHPLKGIIEISTPLVDVEDVRDIIEKLRSEETEMSFSPKEFIALTDVADMWKGDHRVTELDEHVRANKSLYDERPELRDYILSDAYKNEIQVFDGVVDAFQSAYADMYPDRTLIDDVDFRANDSTVS